MRMRDTKPENLDGTPQGLAGVSLGRLIGAVGPRRGLSRPEVARYVGVSPSKFDQLVADGRMPQPKQIDGRLVWDIRALDLAFDGCCPS